MVTEAAAAVDMTRHRPLDQPVVVRDEEDVRCVPLEELDRRVRAAAEVWEALVDECASAGMLPSRAVASLLTSFLERDYWIAEEARIEGLRRRSLRDRTRTLPEPTGAVS